MLVTVHGVVPADDGRNRAYTRFIHMLLHLCDEAFAGPGIRIAAVHETVHVAIRDTVLSRDIKERQKVIQRRVDATGGSESHQVKALASGLGIAESRFNFRVFQDRAVGNGAVNLHQILVNHAPGAYVEVSCFRITHLTVGQAHILSGSLQLSIRVVGIQVVQVWSGGLRNHISPAFVTDSPAIQNDQKRFFAGITGLIPATFGTCREYDQATSKENGERLFHILFAILPQIPLSYWQFGRPGSYRFCNPRVL